MTKFVLGAKSLQKLEGVHKDLVKVVKRAIELTDTDFTVGEGLRTKERQAKLFAEGKSKTLNSKHLTGRAVDLWVLKDGKVTWEKAAYDHLAPFVKQAAKELGINIRWGGDFKGFFDGPHYELV
jgi:peptidoglycan L-alanyl-D-glutamate endopeptidase CwlK